jgi:GH15 family glucan-1,4-alpha-glucosidase
MTIASSPILVDPPIERHGVIGDRRTAALVAADGTLDWLCLPVYDSPPLFGALLDAERGGFWRMGPADVAIGRQRYAGASATLTTTWSTDAGALELADAMLWPWDNRDARHGGPNGRVLLRRLRCPRGAMRAVIDFRPRHDLGEPVPLRPVPGGAAADLAGKTLRLVVDRPLTVLPDQMAGTFELRAGEEVWAILAWGEEVEEAWTPERATAALAETTDYWHDWAGKLRCRGPYHEQMRRSAVTIELLSYAPTGSPVASPTTSLPERIGGDRNWDYRYSWVRDAGLAMVSLTRLGEMTASRRYMDCIASYRSSSESPLQVVYGIDGKLDLPEHRRRDVTGYRRSLPVRIGNRACSQRQLDSLGFFADAALIFLDHGGEWTAEHWEMTRRAADYTAANWRQPDSGIWEQVEERHFVSSKVMSWVALDRAVRIAARTGHGAETDGWREAMETIHAEVLTRGWSEARQSFRQSYETDDPDASALLIPLVGFLPIDHPYVTATVERIRAELTIDGLVHRYIPPPGCPPLSQYEGAFLPCTFWLATVLAMMGREEEARAILEQVEAIAGETCLFAEEIDAGSRALLGNMPLLFSHAEYVRAALQLADDERDVEETGASAAPESLAGTT